MEEHPPAEDMDLGGSDEGDGPDGPCEDGSEFRDRSRLVRTGPFKYLVKGTGFDFLQVRLHLGREPVLLMTCTKTPTGSFVV